MTHGSQVQTGTRHTVTGAEWDATHGHRCRLGRDTRSQVQTGTRHTVTGADWDATLGSQVQSGTRHTGHRCRVGRDTRSQVQSGTRHTVTGAEWDSAICKWGQAASRSAGPPRGPHGTLTEGWGVQQSALDFHSVCALLINYTPI